MRYSLNRAVRQFGNKVRIVWHSRIRDRGPEQRLFIVTEPRSGSNLLLDLLEWHPDIDVKPEVLNHAAPHGLPRWLSQRAAGLEHIRQSNCVAVRLGVCKLMLHQLRQRHITPAMLFEAFPGARFLVLYRKNLLRQYVSLQLMRMTGQHRLVHSETRRDVRFVFDPVDFERWVRIQNGRFEAVLHADARPEGVRWLCYEALAEDPQGIATRLFEWLGLDALPVRPRSRKQGATDLVQSLLNPEDALRYDGPGGFTVLDGTEVEQL